MSRDGDLILNDVNLSENSTGKVLDRKDLLEALKFMILSREIDNKVFKLIKQGKSFFHIPGSGHEAIQIAAAKSMNIGTDWAYPYYRDLAFVLGLGVSIKDIFLHMLGKKDDPMSGGRQMPCHWASNELNIPSQTSTTGMQYLQAVGCALAQRKKNLDAVVYVSSGEGTTSQGEFHEAVNWASRDKLPVVFVIENNKWAISVPVSSQSGGKDSSISEMTLGYENLLRLRVDGTDYNESVIASQIAFDYVRGGKGPALIEADVVRLNSHSSSDDQRKYRTKENLKTDLKNDPIEKLSNKLINESFINRDDLELIRSEIISEIDNAAKFALKQEDPDPQTAERYILDESGHSDNLNYESSIPHGEKVVMVDAVNHALHEEMEFNSNMYIYGQDIADGKGGVFTATKNLSTKFGQDRVFNSPLAEASIIGSAIGMALSGLKPVVEIQFGDYIWTAFMQLRDELVTLRYRSNNKFSAPIVIRVPVGGFIHGGLFHSQNIEGIFSHVPGLLIAYPSNAADAKGLLKTACRLNDPVLFLEHKGLYRQSYATAPEPDENYLLPFGKANVVKEGTDLSVITYGAMVHETNFAVRRLEEEGYSIEVVDIRTIFPLDKTTIFNSVRKTNKAIVVHEDTITSGFGAEIAAQISDNCFENLDGPVKRVAGKDTFIPYHPNLEKVVLPNRDKIYESIKELLSY
ncbi:MAG: dehydrogenase E1 component subunit alpha/beta [Melioribacteraceae bacterium]|nr:dehydrogenase E1 component subunit alpha/beta [Melioribacteraceae bacterium]